jgi:hypothetical protein
MKFYILIFLIFIILLQFIFEASAQASFISQFSALLSSTLPQPTSPPPYIPTPPSPTPPSPTPTPPSPTPPTPPSVAPEVTNSPPLPDHGLEKIITPIVGVMVVVMIALFGSYCFLERNKNRKVPGAIAAPGDAAPGEAIILNNDDRNNGEISNLRTINTTNNKLIQPTMELAISNKGQQIHNNIAPGDAAHGEAIILNHDRNNENLRTISTTNNELIQPTMELDISNQGQQNYNNIEINSIESEVIKNIKQELNRNLNFSNSGSSMKDIKQEMAQGISQESLNNNNVGGSSINISKDVIVQIRQEDN